MNQKPLSEAIEEARNLMDKARSSLAAAIQTHGWRDQIEPCQGLLTCGIETLWHLRAKVREMEIQKADATRGPHIRFLPRGIGRDACPGCFVCGKTAPLLHNIAGFVQSKADGEEIQTWFNGRARLDFREWEPNWIQVKIGACDAHLSKLEDLFQTTSRYSVIRRADIEDAALA